MKHNNGENATTVDKSGGSGTAMVIGRTAPNPISTDELSFVWDLSGSEGVFVTLDPSAVQDSSGPSTDAQVEISKLDKLTKVMEKTIKMLRKNLDYNGYYNAFLLDQINEKEFEKISKKFVVSTNQECTATIESEIRTLVKHTDERFTPSEIADIFHVDESEAERVLENLEI